MFSLYKMLLYILLIANLASCCLSLTPCTDEKVCSANCDGQEVVMTAVYKDLAITGGDYTYHFSCGDQGCGPNNLTTVICQTRGSSSASCAASNSSIWTLLSTDPFILNITYTSGDVLNGKPRVAYIILTVNASAPQDLDFVDEKPGGTYNFRFTVPSIPNGKEKSSHHAPQEGYIGWILIGLSLIGFLLYFIIGSIILRFARGARGLEMIPNLMFWKSFPFLIKDGFLLTISPCYKRARGGYSSLN